jgi:hypothetical protein
MVKKRIGYPEPDLAWYRNADAKTGEHVPITFSKENFLRGFNLTVGEYYIARDALATLLSTHNIYMKKFNDPNVDYDFIWPVFKKINGHELLAYQCHIGWRYHMLCRWITVISAWMKQLDKRSGFKEFPYLPEENWKWGCIALSPKKKLPYQLYKQINMRVVNRKQEVAIIRILDLVEKNKQPNLGTIEDLNLDDVNIQELVKLLDKNPNFTYDSDDVIVFSHALVGHRYISIGSNRHLAYALRQLRTRGSSKINLVVV